MIVAIAVPAVFAVALRGVKRPLIRRSALEMPVLLIAFLDVTEWLLWIACLLAVCVAAPHPVTLLLVALFVVSIAAASRLRYREEQRSLNRWLRMAADTGVALPALLDNLANGCRSRIARQAKRCAKRLHRGQALADAARRARLPLDADTVAATLIHTHETSSDDQSLRLNSIRDPLAPVHVQDESSRSMTLTAQQFTYVVATMVLAWLFGMLIRSHLIPLFTELHDAMPFSRIGSHAALETVAWVGNIIVSLLLAWLLLAGIVRWLPLWMARCVPWFGRKAIDQWRCEILRTLERGMRAGLAETQILQSAAQTTGVRWIRSRCRSAQRLLDAGTPLALAMRGGKIVSGREQVWLTCAASNGNLPDAITKLVSDVGRRQAHRWRIRMAWFVPLATVLVGVFVLAHTMFLFHFLYGLISGMSG
ncbi:type II secretion system F family protein [Stieleria neptunia]|nr:type II secretion system F family protein [Stieleria neptunia]